MYRVGGRVWEKEQQQQRTKEEREKKTNEVKDVH